MSRIMGGKITRNPNEECERLTKILVCNFYKKKTNTTQSSENNNQTHTHKHTHILSCKRNGAQVIETKQNLCSVPGQFSLPNYEY